MARTAEQNEAERSRRSRGRKNRRTREEDDRGCTWASARPQRVGKKARRRGHGWLVAHNATASSTIRVATPIMVAAKGGNKRRNSASGNRLRDFAAKERTERYADPRRDNTRWNSTCCPPCDVSSIVDFVSPQNRIARRELYRPTS